MSKKNNFGYGAMLIIHLDVQRKWYTGIAKVSGPLSLES